MGILLGAGCAGRRYTVHSLPPEYVAKHSDNIAEVGLQSLHVPPVNSQLINQGDVLEVTIIANYGNLTSATTPARVERDGTANIPLVGRVALAGLELDEAEQVIAAEARARGVFQNPHVVVEMKRQYVNKITVIGAVEEQGQYELTRASSTVLHAVVEAGGLSKDAGSEVTIRRPRRPTGPPNPLKPPDGRIAGGTNAELTSYETGAPGEAGDVELIRVNLASEEAEKNGGAQLQDGDVVVVSKRVPKPIYVIGLVRKPDQYELSPNQDTRLLDALAMAGERTMQVADKVYVIRQIPGEKEPIVIQVSVNEAKTNGAANLVLAPGDIVSVEETPVTLLVQTATNIVRITAGGAIGLF